MFTLFAIKAGNESVLLDNAAGPRGEYIYRHVGFIKSKGDRAQYGDDNEMIFPLTGKKKNKDAGQLWRERYNKFRKKLKTKIKNNENCKSFWKSVPTALEAPGPVHMLARGSNRRTRKKKGGNGKDNKTKKKTTECTSIRNAFGQCIEAANKKAAFNERVIRAQDTSLGQPTTQFAPMLMGYPSDKGGGRKRRGGYGPGIIPEQARRMRIRDDRRREEQRRLQIQQALARNELSAAGPGDSVTNQPIEETKRSKALRKIQENNQKIIANRKHRKVEEPKKFTEEELSQIQFEPTHLKKNQIGIVNPDGSLAIASEIHVPWHKQLKRNITRKIVKTLRKTKRKTRVAPMPPVGGRKTKRRRKKHKKTRRR